MDSKDLGARPGRVAARLAKVVERSLGDADISLPQYRLLVFLSERSEAASVLADALAVRPPSVTALVDGLVARGLVERRPDAADRRRVTHALTDRGRRTLAVADKAVAAALTELLDALPAARRRRALEALDTWGEALDEARARARTTTTAVVR